MAAAFARAEARSPCKLDFIRMLRFQELLQMQQHDFGMAWRSEFNPRKRRQLSKM
jgi:hypothetical protein